ncbi:MAG: CDP-alcohol phosphatidyltransferase family protein [Verrucomicrobiae bacterium]|nr:CDP-alcohol phosphatidyltransferase family protein [Verrucomicrobiae bacterium]
MKSKVTCYSGGESRFMDWSQRWRGAFLRPLLDRCSELGLRANHLTLLSLLSGLGFVPALLWGSPTLALACLAIHVILDGLDGPLARHRGQASNRGSFTDTMADQIVVTATTLAMIHTGHASAWPGGLYVFFYAVVVGFAMVRNALNAPYSWLFRPRFVVFAWFVVELYFWPGRLDAVLWIASSILAIKAITGFVKIQRRL